MDSEQELRLVDYLARGKIVPFIGSGLSCNVDLPSWGLVVQSMEKEIEHIDREHFFDTAQRFEEKLGRGELIRILHRDLCWEQVNTEKLDAHHIILDFPFLDFFTTNQDLVLEHVLADHDVPHVPIRSHHDLRMANALAFPRIVKFHGDLIGTDEIVFTRRDVDLRLACPHPFDIYLQGRLIENAVLFIGYGLRDPNVETVWKRVQRHSAPGCEPVGFSVMIQNDIGEIERLRGLGIEPVVIPVADRKDPVELLEWLYEIRSKVHENFHKASMAHFFHGKLPPAQTLTRGQIRVLKKKLETGEPPDSLLKEAAYFQGIPQTLGEDIEEVLLQNVNTVADLSWMWEVAYQRRLHRLATTVLRERRQRQSNSSRDMFQNCEFWSVISHHFDEWAMKVVMMHLEELKSDTGSKETLDHHVVYLFDALRRRLPTLHFTEEEEQEFARLKSFYERKYPLIGARWNSPFSHPNSLRRMTEGLRRAPVYVSDATSKDDEN